MTTYPNDDFEFLEASLVKNPPRGCEFKKQEEEY